MAGSQETEPAPVPQRSIDTQAPGAAVRSRRFSRGLVGPTLWTALAVFGAGWVAFQVLKNGVGSTGNVPQFIIITLGSVSLAGLFFLAAVGLTLIFGLMRVVNMAHGSLYLLGGYFAWALTTQMGFNWWLAAIVATLSVGVLGLVMEQVFLRWNLGQDLRQALITIAISVVLADQVLANFGGKPSVVPLPAELAQPFKIGIYGLSYSSFRLFVIGVALAIGVLLWLWIQRTRFGMVIRAGIDDRAMASALGVNVQVVFAIAFFAGSCLAALSGVFGGTMLSLAPGQDVAFLTSSIVIVIIGGMGSLGGAALGALLLAFVEQYSGVYLPQNLAPYSMVVTFLLVAAVLAVRPQGLFARSER
jgi:branched-chain amino acid transport system permease protein